MPTIRLPTDDDMRAITSKNVGDVLLLPHLYIATADPEVMRSWGVALLANVIDTARLYPGALVAQRFVGQTAERGELVYNGAEPADDFLRPA